MLSGSVTESHCAEYHYADGRCDVKPNLTYAIYTIFNDTNMYKKISS